MKLPSVSIGIPFFNAERFLLDSIKSVFAQTHQDWELILMDDGSTDRSLEIARSINDPRVRVYSDGKNRKLATRLNEIHSLAKFDFVARMDADDLMAPSRISKQLRFLVEHPDIDLVTTGLCSIGEDSSPYGFRGAAKGWALTPHRVLSGAHNIVHAAIVGRKAWFLRNPYDPSDHLGEDYHLWVRSKRKGDLSVGFLVEPLYYYREEGSVTPRKVLASHRRRRVVIRKNGPSMIGRARTIQVLAQSFMKSVVINIVRLLGATKHMVRARSVEADPDALLVVGAEIARIRSVKVPRRQ